MKNKFRQVKNHLRDSRGDGYIWFLAISVVLLLAFGALFTVMSTSMHMRDVRNHVDSAAMDVFAAMRKDSYGDLTDGSTSFTKSELSDVEVMKMMALHLGANYNTTDLHPYVEKYDGNGRLLYRIDTFTYEFLPTVTEWTPQGYVFLGDVNSDGQFNDDDIEIVSKFEQSHIIPGNIAMESLDFDKSGAVNDKDVLIFKALTQYHTEHPSDSEENITDKSSSILVIAFKITVPISFGTLEFSNKSEDCAYYSSFSFLPPT